MVVVGGEMSERTKEKLAWWIAKKLPDRVKLYAFCIVHGLSGDAPALDGEYARAYKLWAKEKGLQ